MPSPKANLALALSAAAFLALLPRPALRFVGYLHEPVAFLLTPVQQPARAVAVWLGGSERQVQTGTATDVARLEANLQEARLELLQSRVEADSLRTLVQDLSRGMELNPTLSVRQVTAKVIGTGSDLSGGLINVRAGSQEGIDANAVVVVRGVYLIGRVQKVEDRTCSVLPITDPTFAKVFKSQKFSGVIMLDDQRRGPAWQLDSIEDGKLIGKVWDVAGPDAAATGAPATGSKESAESKDPAAPDAPPPSTTTPAPPPAHPAILPDMLVRLSDDRWPASAQMLVIGKVERVDPIANDRLVVTIRPIQDIAHVSEVMIRVADTAPVATAPIISPAAPPPSKSGKGGKSKP